ncbi:MAG: hypothetical protein PHI27_13010 [Eubacteriales bacterium]|nr:hypothetical protein [Eubacteriales bacterium]MDD3883142.1 hypothetical protein [Eubacteriales bacterium]MDD4512688.1 hypothetical protein [Eubacteriales bacterium]
MKKIISVIAAMMLLLCCAAASAEPTKITESAMGFDIDINLPEGAVYTELATDSDITIAMIKLADETKPNFILSFASSEEYSDESNMSDLSEEDLNALYQTIAADCDNPEMEIKKLDNNITVMIVNDESITNNANVFTIYRGFFIQISVIFDDLRDITDEDVQTAVDLMGSLTLVEVQ